MFFPTLERIKSIAVKHSGKSYTPQGLTKLIRSQFRDAQLKFYTQYDCRVAKYNILIGGEYTPHDDEDGEPCVHIHLTYTNKKKISIDKINWEVMGFHIATTVTHEYVHQYHIRKRNYQFGRAYQQNNVSCLEENMQDYLGCEDELIAYGFNCAAEIVIWNKPYNQTATYKLYHKHFEKDSVTLEKLRKQTVTYLKRLKEQL